MPTVKDDLARRVRHPGWQAVAAVAIIAVGVTAALGGFRKATVKSTLPQYGSGQTVDNGALRITPLRAWVARHQPGRPAYDFVKKHYLVLQLRVENTTNTSSTTFLSQDVVLLPTDLKRGAKSDGIKSNLEQYARDHSIGVDLHPRLPVEVDLVWELPPGRALPAQLSWGVYKRRFVEKGKLQGDAFWIRDGAHAKLRLPVENRLAGSGPAP